MNILIFLIILLVLVLSHEFGHFIVAKMNRIRVDEFSFGFPPKLFGKKIGETTYNFNALPLGGYVKIYGENGEEELDENQSTSAQGSSERKEEIVITDTIEETITDAGVSIKETITETDIIDNKIEDKDKSRSFVNKPRYIQALVLVAGIVMNLLVAWLLFSVGYMSGLPTSVSGAPKGAIVSDQALTITSVMADSPAQKAELRAGDKISVMKVDTDVLDNPSSTDSVVNFVKDHSNKEINITYIRKGEVKVATVTPKVGVIGETPAIGISMDIIGKLNLPVHKAIWEGLKLTWHVTEGTAVGFYKLIHDALIGKGSMEGLTGPIGIVGVVGDAREFGFIYLLSFTALISVNLAVINLIPFPALDGGRLLFLLIEKIKGSRIKPVVANWANTIGFGLLMLLMAVITFHDIVKLF